MGRRGCSSFPLGLPLFKDGRNISNQDSHSYAVFGNVDYDITSQLRFEVARLHAASGRSFQRLHGRPGDGNAVRGFRRI